MNSAPPIGSPAVARPVAGPAADQNRLSRPIARLLIGTLGAVAAVLVATTALEAGLRYRENVTSAGALQHEMARGVSAAVRQFVRDVETAMRASAQSAAAAAQGLSWAFQIELLDLLKGTPSISAASALDRDGLEVARAARDQLIDERDLRDQSLTVAFQRGLTGATYYGRPYFVRESEPFMTIAFPISWFDGKIEGVLVAEVALRQISPLLAGLSDIHHAGAYVVSGDGALIAHPDISLVLRAQRVGGLDQVQLALAAQPIPFRPQQGVSGGEVFTAYAKVADLDWIVMVERPASELLAFIAASNTRIALLLVVAITMLGGMGLLLWRRVLRPVAALREGAALLGVGRFDHRLAIRTNDEFREIAAAFNEMASRWHHLDATLAAQVNLRRKELATALLGAASFGKTAAADVRLEGTAGLAAASLGRGDIGEAIVLLEGAIADSGGLDPRLLVALETALCRACLLAASPKDALHAYERAVAAAEALDEASVLFHPLHAVASARVWPDVLPVRLDAGRRALAMADRPFDGATGDLAAWYFADLVEAGRTAEARIAAAAAADLAAEHEDPRLKIRGRQMNLLLMMQAGIGAETEAAVEVAQKEGLRAGEGATAGLHGYQMFLLRREQARSAEVRPLIERLRADGDTTFAWAPLLGLLSGDMGLMGQARTEFEQIAAAGFEAIRGDGRCMITLANLAEVCAVLQDAARAFALLPLLQPFAGHNLATEGICLGAADRYLGMLAAARADWAAAESSFERALSLNESSEQPIWRGHTLLDFARALIARHRPGDQARAAGLIDEALSAATALGLTRLRDGCLAVLSRNPREGPLADGLSPAELRVLRLLASGATNRAIGEKLFLSQHTIANHVRSILAKTNSANRMEAANYARRHSVVLDG